MTSQTEERILLEERLRDVLGLREAATLLGYLPRSDPAELATKQDLRELEGRMDARFDTVDARFDQQDARFDRQDSRSDRHDERFDRHDERFDRVDERFDELTAAMHALRVEVKEDIVGALVRTNRTTVIAMLGTIVGSSTLALAILRFAG